MTLRDTLDTVGRLDMMGGINARIRRYHEEHPPEPGDQAGQARAGRDHAVALQQQGDTLDAEGRFDEALKCYQKSRAVFRDLAAAEPAKADLQRCLAMSVSGVGDVQMKQGELATALKCYQESEAIIRKLAANDPTSDPASSGWRRDLSISITKTGNVLARQNELAGALKSFQEALTVNQKLASESPNNADSQSHLSNSFSKIGNVQATQGDLSAALKSYQEALAIDQKLAEDNPDNAKWQRDLSISFEKIGHVQANQDGAAALKSFQSGLAISQKLADKDPANAEWHLDVAHGMKNVGDMLFSANQKEKASVLFEKYRQTVDRLAADQHGGYQVEVDRAVARAMLANCADIKTPTGREESHRLLREAADILHRLEKSPGLRSAHAEWLRIIEKQSGELGQ